MGRNYIVLLHSDHFEDLLCLCLFLLLLPHEPVELLSPHLHLLHLEILVQLPLKHLIRIPRMEFELPQHSIFFWVEA